MTEINQENFEEKTKNGLVLVDFFAPWCGPCKIISPVLEKLEKIKVFKIDVGDNQDISVKFNISHIPCLVFLKEGTEVARFSGLQTLETLQAKVNELL